MRKVDTYQQNCRNYKIKTSTRYAKNQIDETRIGLEIRPIFLQNQHENPVK